jgi:pyridoxal phosphate enzyme (YggS family)
MSKIKDNLHAIKDNITKTSAFWKVQEPCLIVVSKHQPVEKIQEAIAAGQLDFGENRVQETLTKWTELKAQYPQIKLHLIGHLQSNKAKEAVALFDVIHSVDSIKLAKALEKEMQKQGRNLLCLLEVNIGEEEQKHGILPQDLGTILHEITLPIVGLMCIPPKDENPTPYFALLKKLAKENNIAKLSMGMSADYEKATSLGCDYVRVGTAVFSENS